MQDLHDIEAPVQVGIDPLVIQMMIGAAALVLVILIGYLLFRYYRRRKADRALENILLLPPPPPADVAAFAALDAALPLKSSAPRLYYFSLTALIKTFMGKVFHINAPEMTTQELSSAIHLLLPKVPLSRQVMMEIKALFETAAMIKYAAVPPTIEAMDGHEALARKFIETVYREMAQKENEKTDDGNGVDTVIDNESV